MVSTSFKMSVVFAYKKQFAKEMDEISFNSTALQDGSRFLRKGGGHGKCCSARASNSGGAPRSARCGGASRCRRRRPKKTRANKRILLETSSLPNFFDMDFDKVVNDYTSYKAEETRGVVDARNTTNVAKCAVNRYMQDRLQVRLIQERVMGPRHWFNCCGVYNKYSCADNEDLTPDGDETRSKCISKTCPSDGEREMKTNQRTKDRQQKEYRDWASNKKTSGNPTAHPTPRPTKQPDESYWPTYNPTGSAAPSTAYPSFTPTITPSFAPVISPTSYPSSSISPSNIPSAHPSESSVPSSHPSASPIISGSPSMHPSQNPSTSRAPSNVPSESPSLSNQPTITTSVSPSTSSMPTSAPSYEPSVSLKPSNSPTKV